VRSFKELSTVEHAVCALMTSCAAFRLRSGLCFDRALRAMPTDTRLLFTWIAASVPSTALVAAVGAAAYDLIWPPSGGFFSIDFGPGGSALIGGLYGGGYALLLAAPHFVSLWVWVSLARFLGDTDTSRFRVGVGMLFWSLPQAIVVAKLGTPELFVVAWWTVALGLWLPRAVIHSLAPGAFQITSPHRELPKS
jgi:hypothetical protein